MDSSHQTVKRKLLFKCSAAHCKLSARKMTRVLHAGIPTGSNA
jgi:hypothetical protein